MNKLSKERNEELERMINLINEVVEIYEQHQGEPQEKPEITCPQCQKNQQIISVIGKAKNMFISVVNAVAGYANK